MDFELSYRCLSQQIYQQNGFQIEPIKIADQNKIREWRNAQLKLLRQVSPLSIEDQKKYFDEVVSKLFSLEYPDQILFGYYYNSQLIGYGGLVHINWKNKNAEISFLLDPNYAYIYDLSFTTFLQLIIQVGSNIKMHKIFTYGYNLDPKRFIPLIKMNFECEAKLEKHVLIEDKYEDVLIYSKILENDS